MTNCSYKKLLLVCHSDTFVFVSLMFYICCLVAQHQRIHALAMQHGTAVGCVELSPDVIATQIGIFTFFMSNTLKIENVLLLLLLFALHLQATFILQLT